MATALTPRFSTASSPAVTASPAAAPAAPPARAGTPAFARIRLAMFLAGFSTFALIYCVQPLLPAFAQEFGLSPASSSLALSLTTGFLAFAIMVMAMLARRFSPKKVMVAGMFGAAALNLAVALLPEWHGILAARALEGLVLGGVPAVAMAYLAEEIAPGDLGRAMGLYIGGTAFGAMVGRIGMGVLTEFWSWRVAMEVLGAFCLAAAIGFALLLPPARQPAGSGRGGSVGLGFHLKAWRAHLGNPALQRLYLLGFCLTSVFSTVFNYATFRLVGDPYGLSPSMVSLIFLTFGFGIVSSSLAGSLSDRLGRRPMLVTAFGVILTGVLVTLAQPIALICLGIALIATGFFIGHSVASSAVGAAARGNKGHATALYLMFYYAGASLTGWAGGWFWQQGGWPGLAGLTGSVSLLGLAVAAFGPRVSAVQAGGVAGPDARD